MKALIIISLMLLTFTAYTDAQNRSGKYEYSKVGEYKTEYWGFVEIKEVTINKKKSLKFRIEAGAHNKATILAGCVGSLEGYAKWTGPNVAEYDEPIRKNSEFPQDLFCHLTFFFTGNKLVIRPKDCGSHHGANCSFEGTFTKKGKTTPRKK